jgi:hypothetical protein
MIKSLYKAQSGVVSRHIDHRLAVGAYTVRNYAYFRSGGARLCLMPYIVMVRHGRCEMLRMTTFFLLATISGAAYADVLDHSNGLVGQLVHQLLGTHHFPLTVLLVVIGVFSIRHWRASRNGTRS